MCAIAGIFAYSAAARPVDRAELIAIRDHMAARGPDGAGAWYSADNRLGLAHRRLAIIDLSDRGAQPMVSADGRYHITFNGEIYNYRELKRGLEAQGRAFASDSDTEVLLHLYAIKGEAMLPELRGMFAFAIWDALEKSLFIARDAFGIKPLYYADDGKTFRFASQVKALQTCNHIDTSPQPAGHVGFYLWGSVPQPWTLYRGIRNLPAGHSLRVGEHGAGQPKPFQQVPDILRAAAPYHAIGSRSDALVAISDAVRDSVAAHQIADVSVAVFLSAGLDSAMIAALAARGGSRPSSVTLGFAEYSGGPNDESPMAGQLASLLGTNHASLTVRRADFEADRQQLLTAMDQPSIDGVNTWFVAKAAASQGIKVALSGLGGDELFASYPSFSDLPRITRLASPWTTAPGFGRGLRKLSLPLISRFTSPKYAGLLEYGGTLGGAYLLRRGLYMPWELPNVLDPDLAREGWHDLQTEAGLDEITQGVDQQRLAISALEMTAYMRNQLLRDADWAGMAHSLEIRVPFVDTQLLETVAPWLAAHPDIRKSEVAASIAPQLPPALLNKPKTGFSVPVRDWLNVDNGGVGARGLRGWAQSIHHGFVA